ncbi:unnamed protein product [Paramecium primaurelia]|uniref:Uncharacterized protein n=1 Tax=Paramecium primaurelia TaxID=5886 RepID=A0A8S1QUG7_PARPR|nr:unnamed protein product [Paramecium primaurelia]CAD8118468.1 unnamed protein product [Paramecium primaurelia]
MQLLTQEMDGKLIQMLISILVEAFNILGNLAVAFLQLVEYFQIQNLILILF